MNEACIKWMKISDSICFINSGFLENILINLRYICYATYEEKYYVNQSDL